jgi:putative endonuclease
MYYVYILYSSKSKSFYFGYTEDFRKRIKEHNSGLSKATAPYMPWKLVFYSAFDTMKKAKNFELYLKSGSGKAFAYKRLLNSEALKKDVTKGRR